MLFKTSNNSQQFLLLVYFAIVASFMFTLFNIEDKNFFINFTISMFNSVELLISFFFDPMGLIFLFVLLIISSASISFSAFYMKQNFLSPRFNILIILFVTSMILLIFSLNLFWILLGWDGLGLTSYILISFLNDKNSHSAATMTIMTNRIGDTLLIATLPFFFSKGTSNFLFSENTSTESILICFASMTKSAQIPFSAWLPAAMAAPTPVSALVHSSTLVTAGIYLLIRFSHTINFNQMWTFLFSLTSITASFCAIYEYNIKKIIALSTLSQLGLMMFSISLKLPLYAFFHLITHATFKSLMFMSSGVIITSNNHQQDTRMITLKKQEPITATIFCLTNLALSGIFFLSGFYSKDLIFEKIILLDLHPILLLNSFLMLFITSIYSMRMIMFSFLKPCHLQFSKSLSSFNILITFMLLTPLSLMSGNILSYSIFKYSNMICTNTLIKTILCLSMFLGFFLGLTFKKSKFNPLLLSLKSFFNLPFISYFFPSLLTLSLSTLSLNTELFWTEKWGPDMIYILNKKTALFSFHNFFSTILALTMLLPFFLL